MHAFLRQPALGVEGGHAAGAGGSDGLAIVAVGHVAGGEDARHARVRPLRRRQADVLLLRQLHLPFEEVGVRVESENPLTGERRHTSSAYLTFVALSEAGKPVAVHPVIPETAEEKRRYEMAQDRRENRLQFKRSQKI